MNPLSLQKAFVSILTVVAADIICEHPLKILTIDCLHLFVTVIMLFDIYLGFEGMVLLAEVLLPVMLGVAPLVAPLECLVSGHVYVLEVVVRTVLA